jgi:trigger factor
LKEYKGITLREQPESASDEDVERSVDALRREQATLVPVERPVQMGDFPTLDYVGKIDGVAFEGGSAENQPTEISADRFIPGFAEGIVGMQAGETKEIEARFPEDYPNRELAGKTAVFTVTVRDVKERELPPLDDAFAARLAKDATLLSLKTDLRTRLDAAAKSRARRARSNELLDRLLELHDFPLPTVLVDREVDALIDERKSYVVRFGRSWDEYLSSLGLNETSLREEMRTEAERRVRVTLLLEAIAKAEGIKATPADVEAEVTSLSQQYGQPREKILAALQPTMGSFIEGIVRAKTLDTLLEVAKIEAAPVAGAEGGDAGSGATNAGSP